jgi:EmrB/QacA subfamily drug resistance transporter
MSATIDQSAAPSAGQPARPSHYEKRWLALAVIAIAQLMVVLDGSIVNIAMPSAQLDLGISDVDRHWIITAYTLTFGGLLLLGGRIADYMGRKKAFIVGLVGFAAASAIGGIAVNAMMLYSSRALQGVFAALLAPAALSLVAVTFTDAKERAKAFAVYGAISGGGLAIGLIAGGILTEYASWRWCLLVNIPIALIAAAGALSYVGESKAEGNTRYDIPGAVLVTSGLVALVYGFTEAAKPGVGWAATSTIACLVAAVILLVGFVLVELRSSHPLLPMRVVLDRNRGGAYLVAMCVSAGMFGVFLFLTYYFQINLGYSALKTGFAFLPLSVGIIGTAVVVSKLLPRFGPKPLMLFGLSVAIVGMLLFTQLDETSSWVVHVLPSELLLSIGLSFVFVPMSVLALVKISNHDTGVASAMLNATQQIGGSLGTALLNTIFASAVAGYLTKNLNGTTPVEVVQNSATLHGYRVAYVVSAGIMAIGLVLIALLVTAKKEDVGTDAAVGMH